MSVVIDKKKSAGFFACCSRRLHEIIKYINKYKKLPISIDTSKQFKIYKKKRNSDITFDFFKNYQNININYELPIIYSNKDHYLNYANLDYNKICPIVKKYFSVSKRVLLREKYFLKKYKIDVSQHIAIYYRGTDKCQETALGSFDDYYLKTKEILDKNPNLKLLLVSDSQYFLDYFKKKYKKVTIITENKSSYTDKGIHKENSRVQNYDDISNLLPTFLIVSKCQHIIFGCSNCSMWIVLFRGNCQNVSQCSARGKFF